jgi:hypothetical protein
MKRIVCMSAVLLIVGCEDAPRSAPASLEYRPQANLSVDSSAFTPGHGLPTPGSWTPTRSVEWQGVTLEIPVSAEARPGTDEAGDFGVSGFPECRWPCGLRIRERPESLDSAVAAETRGDGSHEADELSTILDTLPVNGRRAARLERYCGDCSDHVLLIDGGDHLVEVEYVLDDREGDNPALERRLEGVARTARVGTP